MKSLFYEPGRIGNVEIRNRLVMGPAGFGFCDETEGRVNDKAIEFFRQRARGGVGLIDIGALQIDPTLYTNYDMLKIFDDSYIPDLRRLTDAIHAEGAKVMGQLLHQGRYCASKQYDGKTGVAPSAVFARYTGETPRELSLEECEELVRQYGLAAGRAVKAGFDAVEICTNSGYLIGQFLSPVTNLRTDKYGGATVAERMTFLLEVVDSIRGAVGADFPISVRVGGNDFVPGSNTNDDAVIIASILEKAGVNAINVTGGWHETFLPQVTMDVPYGVFSYCGKRIKDAVSIPVIQSNRMNVATAERLIDEGVVDFVSMARPLVADPYLMRKASEGRYSEIRPCVGCNQGCLDHIMRHMPITCLVNAEVGREFENLKDDLLPTERVSESPEKILVVGSGPSGMEFARIAKCRGHEVTIWEKRDKTGGQFEVNSAPPGRHDFANFGKYLAAEMQRLEIPVVFGKEAGADEILSAVAAGEFDRVVIATGAAPIAPNIPTEEGTNVVQAWDVLRKRVRVGKKIVVVGGGAVGVETSEFLAEMGTMTPDVLHFLMFYKAETPESLYNYMTHGTKDVTLVEMAPKIGRDIGITTRWSMLARIKALGVKSMPKSKVVSLEKAGVRIEKEDGSQELIPADTVVLAVGSRSENALYSELEGKLEKLSLIGDAQKPAFILDAVRSAYDAAYKL